MKVVVAVTGASGIAYAKKAIGALKGQEVSIVLSQGAKLLAKGEGVKLPEGKNVYVEKDFFAPFASGSNAADAMLVIPCSLKTLSAIANGYGDNLISRSAEVCIKEGKRLVLVVRETPLSPIALENCLKLARMGVVILPACPAFYNKPKSIGDMVDFVAGKALDSLGVKNSLYKRWENGKKQA
ncbi:UbiX family flavin prenyltransferase [Candidatus Micrarchaeota archaeon]|nr:UbiX family flavin prenyltransferase [Candidatus Micrarchaeota archaeon]